MKTLLTLLLAFLLLNETGLAQPYLPHLKPYLKNGNDTIHFSGDSFRFKVMNVCTSDLIMGFDETGGASSQIVVPGYTLGISTMVVLDSTDMPKKITGVAGTLGNSFATFFTSTDSFYIREYYFMQGMSQIVRFGEKSLPIDSIIGLIADSWDYWVLAKRGDSSVLYEVNYTYTGFSDSVSLPINTLGAVNDEFYSGGAWGNATRHFIGTTKNDSQFYCEFNVANKALFLLNIDTIPGNIRYFNRLDDKVFFISSDSTYTYATDYFHNSDSFSISVLTSFQEVIDVNKWYERPIPSIGIIFNDTVSANSLIVTYNINTWAPMDTITLPFVGQRLFAKFQNDGYFHYLVHKDSTQTRFLSLIDLDGTILSFGTSQFPNEDPGNVNSMFVCFVGIDNNSPPAIQTYAYPNPSTDRIEVVIKNVPCDMDHYLELVDLQGRRVYEAKFVSKCDMTVPVAHLASGMYILKLHIAGAVYTHKLMKQ